MFSMNQAILHVLSVNVPRKCYFIISAHFVSYLSCNFQQRVMSLGPRFLGAQPEAPLGGRGLDFQRQHFRCLGWLFNPLDAHENIRQNMECNDSWKSSLPCP